MCVVVNFGIMQASWGDGDDDTLAAAAGNQLKRLEADVRLWQEACSSLKNQVRRCE